MLVLGSLAPQKGLNLLRECSSELTTTGELFLLGCGAYGEEFRGAPGVTVIPEFAHGELGGLLHSIRSDLALLLSVVPETFSYTLHELLEARIPVAATRLGSFADRIEHGRTGFLFEPTPAALSRLVKQLASDGEPLDRVRRELRSLPPRTLEAMFADYRMLLGTPAVSAAAYAANGARLRPGGTRVAVAQLFWRCEGSPFEERCSSQAGYAVPGPKRTLRLPVSTDRAPAELRLDISDRRGLLRLHSLRLISPEGARVWSWEGEAGVLDRAAAFQVAISHRPLDGGVPLVCCTGPDPWIILPVPPEALARLAGGGALEVALSALEDDRALPALAGSIAAWNETVRAANASAARLRAGAESAERTLSHAAACAQARVAEIEASLSWRLTAPLRALLRR
jgi:hypothetical protein